MVKEGCGELIGCLGVGALCIALLALWLVIVVVIATGVVPVLGFW